MKKEDLFIKRGNRLWEGSRMMLPEHKEGWLKMQKHENDVLLHEELAADTSEQFATVITNAFHDNKKATVTLWREGQYLTLTGYITKIDLLNKRFKLAFGNDYEWLHFRFIKDVWPNE